MRNNVFDDIFKEFIEALNWAGVEYILVGGFSVILHGYERTTGDMDLWVNPTKENFKKLVRAFGSFGMSLFDLTEARFLDTDENDVFSFGRPPSGIDIMTKVKGLEFGPAFEKSEWFEIDDNLKVRVIRLADLLTAKEAAGRFKDRDDIENLKKKKRK